MSRAAALAYTAPAKTSAYMDILQMVSGAVLILFMWSHLVLVSSVLIGPKVMNSLAWFFEATYMAQVGGPIVGAIFLLHFVLAARKAPFRTEQQTILAEHARRMNHGDTWLWVVQAGSAMIILIMGAIHLWVVLTDLPISAQKSAARVQTGFWLAFYLVLLPMVELHVGIGFYRIGVKWGFITRSTRAWYKQRENVLTLTMISIGLLTLLRFWLLRA